MIVADDKNSNRSLIYLSKEKMVWESPEVHSSDLSRIVLVNSKGPRSIGGKAGEAQELVVEIDGDLTSRRSIVIFDRLTQVIVNRRIKLKAHSRRKGKRSESSSCNCSIVITASGFSVISRSRRRASASPPSSECSGNERKIFPTNSARSFSDRLKTNFSASATSDIPTSLPKLYHPVVANRPIPSFAGSSPSSCLSLVRRRACPDSGSSA